MSLSGLFAFTGGGGGLVTTAGELFSSGGSLGVIVRADSRRISIRTNFSVVQAPMPSLVTFLTGSPSEKYPLSTQFTILEAG
jgi:hypothetical protein